MEEIFIGEKEKLSNKRTDKQYVALFCYTIHLAYLKVYTKFENTGSKRRQKFSLEKKKNDQIKGLISNMWLFLVTQYNPSLSSFVPNFRILSQVVAEKYLTKNVY